MIFGSHRTLLAAQKKNFMDKRSDIDYENPSTAKLSTNTIFKVEIWYLQTQMVSNGKIYDYDLNFINTKNIGLETLRIATSD